MQEEEENLPGVIRRLKANEADLMRSREIWHIWKEKKLEWSMQRSDSAKVQKVTRTAACYLLAVFITLFAFVGILSWYLNRDLQLVFTIMGFAAVGAGAFILIRYQGFYKRDPSGGCQPQSGDYFGEPGKDPLCQYEKTRWISSVKNIMSAMRKNWNFYMDSIRRKRGKRKHSVKPVMI